jgi:pimeloyl-ACP methyl ester carboxylesterase
MGELIPQARTLWVPGKGHLLNWEAPDVVVEAIQSL